MQKVWAIEARHGRPHGRFNGRDVQLDVAGGGFLARAGELRNGPVEIGHGGADVDEGGEEAAAGAIEGWG